MATAQVHDEVNKFVADFSHVVKVSLILGTNTLQIDRYK